MKRLILLSFVSFLGGVFATPTISDVKVTPIPPWGIAIDYNVSGVEAENLPMALRIAAIDGGVTNVATSLSGETDFENGDHRVYWNMSKDGITSKTTTGSVSVSFLRLARYYILDLSSGCDAESYSVSCLDEPPNEGFTNEVYKTTKLVLKCVDAGSFIMGDDQTDESHRVTLTKPFYMGLYEVTQKQWELVMGTNPSYYTTDGAMKPVEQVSYSMIRGSTKGANWPASDAVDGEDEGDGDDSFLGRLRRRTGVKFDLPTEAQWEYTCRAGTTTTYSFGDSAGNSVGIYYMWYHENNGASEKEVGLKLPNKWGFYDMHGNVLEWCLDRYGTLSYGTDPNGSSSGSFRVARGGDFLSVKSYCTSSRRDYFDPSSSHVYTGFRLALPIR